MTTTQDFSKLAPAGYSVALCQVFDDASSISLQLDCNGARVCGNLVAGRWSFHVPQNKLRTASMNALQLEAIGRFAHGVEAAIPAEWHGRHAEMYGAETQPDQTLITLETVGLLNKPLQARDKAARI